MECCKPVNAAFYDLCDLPHQPAHGVRENERGGFGLKRPAILALSKRFQSQLRYCLMYRSSDGTAGLAEGL